MRLRMFLGLKPLPGASIASAIAEAEDAASGSKGGAAFRFSEDQRRGIGQAANEGLFLLTGGPGTLAGRGRGRAARLGVAAAPP